MKKQPDQDKEITLAILHYLQEHPDAKDTLEGIAQWWVLTEWTERKVSEVQSALSVLLDRDLIVETRRKGSPPYYRLNKRKKREVQKTLNSR